MIRVLHAVPRMNREGIQSFVMNIYRNIDRKKIQFDFLVHSKEKGDFDDEILSFGGKIYRLGKLSSLQFFSYKKDVSKILQTCSYKIIHSHINLLSTYPLKIAMQNGVPSRIAHSHSSSILDRGIKKIIKLQTKKKINSVATYQFACSKEAAIWQFGEDAWNNEKIKIIPNGIDIDSFLFTEEHRKKIRELYSIEENVFVVGHVGAFREVKNHSFLLKIFAEIKKLNSNSRLLLLGSGELEKKLKEDAKKLSIYDDIILIGNVSNVGQYLSCMDAFVFPSIYEGLGIALVEAQASGLPCFVSDSVCSETKLQENYFSLSLSLSPCKWARFILENKQNTHRKCSFSVFQYDIKRVAKTLEEFYLKEIETHS